MSVSASAGFVGSLGIPLVPLVAETYGATLGQAQWMATISLLIGAVSTPILGRLSHGRDGRRLMWIALSIATLGGLLSTFHGPFWLLVAGRALQGVGMSLAPLAIATARLLLTDAAFIRTVGYLSVSAVAGAGAAFPLMTWIASTFGLHAAFAAGAVLSGATLLASIFVIPATASSATRPTSVDPVGAVLLSTAISTFLLLITQPRQEPARALLFLALTVTASIVLVIWERRHPSPFIDFQAHLGVSLRAVNLMGVLVAVGAYAALALLSLRVQAPADTGYGLASTAFIAGSMIVPFAVFNVVGGRLFPTVYKRLGGLRTLTLGSLLVTLGTAALSIPYPSFLLLGATMAVVGLGAGLTFSGTPAVISGRVTPQLLGTALSVNLLLRYLGFASGGAIAIAVLELMTPHGDLYPDTSAFMLSAVVCSIAPAGAMLFSFGARRHEM